MNTLALIAAVMMIFVISVAPAYAYLDPGTGSMLIQGFIAAVARRGDGHQALLVQNQGVSISPRP